VERLRFGSETLAIVISAIHGMAGCRTFAARTGILRQTPKRRRLKKPKEDEAAQSQATVRNELRAARKHLNDPALFFPALGKELNSIC